MSSRRDFLADLPRCAALAATVPTIWRVTHRPRLADDPFQLGVASGNPLPNGAVLWTRLAPRPLEPDGGLTGLRVVVEWMVADDESFTRVVRRGQATAAPELAYSIHVDVDGLEPDRWYFYRFSTAGATGATSPVGRLRTAPAAGAVTPLRFAVASCQHFEQGLYTAYAHMAREEIDLVAHLGDYIYEYGASPGRVRAHSGLEVRTLDDYRRRYAQYKLDPLLRAAHERCPWIVTWDDHDVDNNYAGLWGEHRMESEEQMHLRRAAAYQAWWEHMPVRVPRARSWGDLTIRQSIDWGALARFWVLDTRQYRSDQACDDGTREVPCGDWDSPDRTMLGDEQERWLTSGLASSRANWQVLAQQVMMAPYDFDDGTERRFSMDQWSGYPAARDRLLNAIATHGAGRTVVLTGDIHASFVNDLRRGFEHPGQPVVAAEFVGTSITSGGDGADSYRWVEPGSADNSHLLWHNARRGYMTCSVTPESWHTAYRVIPYVTRAEAPVVTATEWRLTRGKAGIERV